MSKHSGWFLLWPYFQSTQHFSKSTARPEGGTCLELIPRAWEFATSEGLMDVSGNLLSPMECSSLADESASLLVVNTHLKQCLNMFEPIRQTRKNVHLSFECFSPTRTCSCFSFWCIVLVSFGWRCLLLLIFVGSLRCLIFFDKLFPKATKNQFFRFLKTARKQEFQAF